MLSQSKGLNKTAWAGEYPAVEPHMTVRIHFEKTGKLQYISHLDLQRTFYRIIKRAGIPVWYTKGFNPHAKLVFSTPLSVGSESVCEYLDLRIDRKVPYEILCERLQNEVTEELAIREVYAPVHSFSEIAYARYRFVLHTAGADEEMAKRIETFFATSPIMMTKKTKSGDKEIDIVPLIHSLTARYDEAEKGIVLDAVLSAATDRFLNPEMLVSAMKTHLGVLCTSLIDEHYTIMRTQILLSNMEGFR